MKSMTGYGKAICSLPGKKVTIEIKSLNSKQLDLNLKIPFLYRERESEIRSLVSGQLERGKVDVYLTLEYLSYDNAFTINRELAAKYQHELTALSASLNAPLPQDMLSLIIKMPDVVKATQEEADDNEWIEVKNAFHEALSALDGFRKAEGKNLAADIRRRIGYIQGGIPAIELLEPLRIQRIRNRIGQNVAQFADTEHFDRNRLEQEIIYYLEKIDFTEEKTRLSKHCTYFLQTMEENGNNGRKLSFIVQEIGRELNTLGSKANDAEIQKNIVMMKDELEKIKEQLLNIL